MIESLSNNALGALLNGKEHTEIINNHKKMKKKLLWGLLVPAFLFAGIGGVLADGMIIHPDPYSGGWDYSDEADQQAFINYQNGLEKMIVGVKIDNLNDDAVWLFPVPADPSKVVIDVIDDLPLMTGKEINSAAEASLVQAKDVLFGSQIYPLFFMLNGHDRGYMPGGMDEMGMVSNLASDMRPLEANVTVYEHLDKEGLSSELITAKTGDGIYDYFEKKGLKIEKNMIPALDAYIGKDYSFVVTWIDNGAKENINSRTRPSRAYIEENLDAYIGIPGVQSKLYEMKTDYPQLDVAEDALTGDITVNADQVIPYLGSDEGAAALDKLVAEIETDSSLEGTAISSGEAGLIDDWSQETSAAQALPSTMPSVPGGYYPDYYPQRNNVKGISVYFPTDNIYFPLLPTSVYESKTVPITIKVAGLVDPRVYDGINNFTKTSYYSSDYYEYSDLSAEGKESDFFEGADLNYTKIEINAPSKYLTEDLWIRDKAPLKAVWAWAIAEGKWVVTGILLILCSLGAALIAGSILFKGLRKKPGKLVLLGLANCLTLAGLAVAAMHADNGEAAKKEDSALIEKIRAKGYGKKRRNAKILFFAAILMFLSMTAGLSGISYLFNFGYYSYYIPYQLSAVLGLAFAYLPLVLAFFGWRAAQVDPADKAMFDELKAKGYSSWSLVPRSKNNLLFVALFSAVFLLLSAAAVWLLGKTI